MLETPNANVGAGMQYLKSAYALWFNDFRPRGGVLFERRYWAEILQRDEHLFNVSRYVVLNPVRARICRHPADWAWSSYRATAALVERPPFLTTEFIHGIFAGSTPAPRRYAQFVLESIDERPV